MARSKKVGGVKSKRQGLLPAVVAPTEKKIGGVKPGVRGHGAARVSQQQSCPDNCVGETCEGMWIHSSTCKWSAVLWRLHGKTKEHWQCPFGCEPIEIPSGWTHPFNCRFWDATGRTPIDHSIPGGVVGVGQAYRPKQRGTNSRALLPADFEDKRFGEWLDGDGDDDLPF